MVYALEAIKAMPGGTQPVLMHCSDGYFYVVKPSNNLQGAPSGRILTNDFLGSRLASMLGLSVPPCAVVDVSSELIADSPLLRVRFGFRARKSFFWKPGPHFGSRFPGDPAVARVLKMLPAQLLGGVENLDDFVGMLCLDRLCGQVDGRQAMFVLSPFGGTYRVVFIDQGFYFGADKWVFYDLPRYGLYQHPQVYRSVRGFSSFAPWLARIRANWDAETIATIAGEVPPAWYEHDQESFVALIEQLQERPTKLPQLLRETARHAKSHFPRWNDQSARGPLLEAGSA